MTAVVVEPQSATLGAGATGTLTATLSTSGTAPASGWTTTWTSSDPSVVSVSQSGALTALAAGTATITATAGGKSASATITVVAQVVQDAVTSITLSPATLTLLAGNQGTLAATLTTTGTAPAGGWPVSWGSTEPSIATVSSAGVVSALAAGTTTIFVTAGGKQALSLVIVERSSSSPPAPSRIDSISIYAPSPTYLVIGYPRTFKLTVNGSAPAQSLTWPGVAWTSSNPAVATVSPEGIVTPIAAGLTTLTASLGGKSSSVTVESLVPPGVDFVQIAGNLSPLSLQLGDKVSLAAVLDILNPSSTPAGGLVVNWTSSNPAVATVITSGMNGLVTAVGLGTATITLNAYGKSASLGFTVIPKVVVPPPPDDAVSAISIQPTSILMSPGGEFEAKATVTATTAPPAKGWPITWSSSDSSVMLIGMATAAGTWLAGPALGKATLTATLSGKSATANVYVADVTSFVLSPTTLTLAAGEQRTMDVALTTVGVLPPTGWPVGWRSTSPLVATVSTSGVVTALAVGRTRIWAGASQIYKSSVVTVTGPLPSVLITGADTVKAPVTQTSAGYKLVCPIKLGVTMTGPGELRWTSAYVAIDGGPYTTKRYPFAYSPMTAGYVEQPWESAFDSPVLASSADALVPFSVGVQFHYFLNADLIDLSSGLPPDYIAEKKTVCIP